MSARDNKIAKYLSEQGKDFSVSLRDDNRWYFTNLSNSYFAIAAALGLTWTKHAKFEREFVEYAANYLDLLVERDPSISIRFCLRFGSEDLDSALLNYRNYHKHIRSLLPDFYNCDINDLARLQQRLLNELNRLRNERLVEKIGPWLFTGPFKIILGDQDRLWTHDAINAIVLPTGMEVDKGVKRLFKEKYSFMKDFSPRWLELETKSLLDNYATYTMVHTYIANIGKLTGTPAIHINSALYLFGRNDI
jgi:hypothetical protein